MKRKKLFILFAAIMLILGCAAQSNKPLKGKFVKETDTFVIEANFNLYEKTVNGESGFYYDETENQLVAGEGKCYGTIEITNERGVTGYDIVGIDSVDSPEPNIYVVSWSFPENGQIRVGINYYDQTIILNDWEGGIYFNNLTLKKEQ